MKKIMPYNVALLLTACLLGSTIVFSSTNAQQGRIDEEGNIILPQENRAPEVTPKPQPQPQPQRTPGPQVRPPAPNPAPTKASEPKASPAPTQKPAPSTQPATPPAEPETTAPSEAKPQSAPATQGKSVRQMQATVRAERVNLLREARADAQKMALLRRGQQVDVLGVEGQYARVRFTLEGGFDLEGWLPSEALITSASGEAPSLPGRRQNFRPGSRELSEAQRQATGFPETLESLPEDPEALAASEAAAQARLFTPSQRLADNRVRLWSFEAGVLGAQLKESFQSRLDTGAYGSNFFEYALMGIGVEAQAKREFPQLISFADFRAKAQYQFLYFDNELDAKPGFDQANALAQWHQLRAEAELSRRWDHKRWSWIGKVSLGPQFQFYNVNSLSDSQGRTPLLFGHWMAELRLALGAEFILPQDFRANPSIQIQPLSIFQELDTGQTDGGDPIRTGTAKSGTIRFSASHRLSWNMKRLHYPHADLYWDIFWQDFSRNYSGIGNRAAVQTEDAKSKSRILGMSLGLAYRF